MAAPPGIKLSSTKIVELVQLREQGVAYKKIAKRLQVSPSSVYKYAKSVELSEEQKLALQQNEIANQKNFALSHEKEIKSPVLDEDFANLLGHFFFDGSVFSGRNAKFCLGFTNASRLAIDSFLEKMHVCFGLAPPKVYKRTGKKLGWFEVQFYSKRAYLFLKEIAPTFSTPKGAAVPNLIKSANTHIRTCFLRAFWDDEGSIGSDDDLSGCSTSEPMIDDLVQMHLALGIDCYKRVSRRKKLSLFLIIVRRSKENVARFIDLVGFEHAIVAKGYNVGKYKKDVLAHSYAKRYASRTNLTNV